MVLRLHGCNFSARGCLDGLRASKRGSLTPLLWLNFTPSLTLGSGLNQAEKQTGTLLNALEELETSMNLNGSHLGQYWTLYGCLGLVSHSSVPFSAASIGPPLSYDTLSRSLPLPTEPHHLLPDQPV